MSRRELHYPIESALGPAWVPVPYHLLSTWNKWFAPRATTHTPSSSASKPLGQCKASSWMKEHRRALLHVLIT